MAQIAKRTIELSKFQGKFHVAEKDVCVENQNHHVKDRNTIFNRLHIRDNFILSNDSKNKWFITKTNDLVAMENATYYQGKVYTVLPLKQKQISLSYL